MTIVRSIALLACAVAAFGSWSWYAKSKNKGHLLGGGVFDRRDRVRMARDPRLMTARALADPLETAVIARRLP